MATRSLLKTPFFVGGAVVTGAGGVGFGGWKIYDESNPTVDRQLRKQKLSYRPVSVPNEGKPENQTFGWNDGDCIKRLFPGLTVKHDLKTDSGDSGFPSVSISTKNENQFITCAIMEMTPSAPTGANVADKFKNRIYLKSEVVIKGKDYGLIIWTGLSTAPQKKTITVDNGDNYTDGIEFEHRLLGLKRDNGKWSVHSGYGGDDTSLASSSEDYKKLIITPPMHQEQWFRKPRIHSSSDEFNKKFWAGIGEVDANGQSILSSISIYEEGYEKYAEFWGSDGEFTVSESNQSGYTVAERFYKQDEGGIKIAYNKEKNIQQELKEWYKPFKTQKIKGTDGQKRCDAFSAGRKLPETDIEKDLQNLCYQ